MNAASELRRLRRYVPLLEGPDAPGRDEPRPVVPIPDIVTFATHDDYLGLALYPRQLTLLKTVYLGLGPGGEELLTDYDRGVLGEWSQRMIDTGEGGVQPDLFERIAWNREQGRQWFREIVFVGGRRASKSLLGSIILAYNLWLILQHEDPQAHFGVPARKRLVVLIFAGQHDQAK